MNAPTRGRQRSGRPATRRAGRNRPEILRSAGEVIAARGVEETRFADVAEQSGASISTLQYLFGSREDLMIATLRHTADDFLSTTTALVASIDEPTQRLRALVRDMLSVESSDEQACIDWAVWVEYWRAASRDAELAVEAEQTYETWYALLADAIEPLASSRRDADALARAGMTMIDGFGIQVVLSRGAADREHAASTVLRWLGAQLGRDDLA